MKNNYLPNFTKHVSANIIGTIGLSLYIFADTYFISYYAGLIGLTALNISLPIYSLIYGLGYLIGVGGGTNFSYLMAKDDYKKAKDYFNISISYAIGVGLVIGILGFVFSKNISLLLGANSESIIIANTYIKTLFVFVPFFIVNTTLLTFLRYDDNPRLAMTALLSSSFFNIIGDYVFMEYFRLGVFGAALATGLAPIVSILVASKHIVKRKGAISFERFSYKFQELKDIIKLGTSTFVYEMSQGLVILAFNYLILNITGNIGIAAYGIITNIGTIVMSIFNGMQQGLQPLISYAHGKRDSYGERQYLKYGFIFSTTLSVVIYFVSVTNLNFLVGIFNSQNVELLSQLAKTGVLIYFLGFLPHSLNLTLIAYKNAINQPRASFILSLCRGTIFPLLFALLFSKFFGMIGIWLSFLLAEVTTLGLYFLLSRILRKNI